MKSALHVRPAYDGEGMIPMNDKPDKVLTIDDLSAYLKISKSTLYKLVREGKIPCQKVGRHWRFLKAAIDRWLENVPTETLVNGGGGGI